MLNYEHIILKYLANCYRHYKELCNKKKDFADIEFWWNNVLCYKGILKAVYKEPFTLLLEDDYSMVVHSDELLHI